MGRVAAEKRAIDEYKFMHNEMNTDNQISKQIADLEENLILIEEAESIAGKIVEAQTFWKYEGVPAPGDNEKTPITAGTSQMIVNELKEITTTFENLDRERNTVKLQEEILSAKEYIQYLKSALTIFTNTSSIQTAIYETEASIIIYDGVIVRLIQEAETNTDTSRKEKSHSTAGDLSKNSSIDSCSKELEDEEARKRKVEEPHEKSDIPELTNRLMRIKLETAEKENDDADPGDHNDRNEKKEERDHEDDDSRKRRECDESRGRKAGQTESSDTSQRRSKSRGEKSKDAGTKQRLPMLMSEDYRWSGNTVFLQ